MTFYQIKKIVFRFMPPPLDQINGQWTIDNGQLTIDNWKLFFHLPFINGTDSATVEAQRCCASQLHFTTKWQSIK